VAWFDLLVPKGDPLWDEDVGRAVWWVGEAWTAVLADLGLRADVHRGPLTRPPWSDRVCFAGLGAGEVSVGGRKVVGISQRRVRDQARFQCAALLAWRPDDLVDLLALDEVSRRRCRAEVANRAAGLADLVPPGFRLDVGDLEDRLLAALPD
jgi:lipoate-protein ligase A